MSRDFKIFGASLGRERIIVAAKSQKEAAEAFGWTLHTFRQYACETGNAIEIGVALNMPGIAFVKPHNDQSAPFRQKED